MRSRAPKKPAPAPAKKASGEITLAWESVSALLDAGLERLVRQHWREVGVHKREMPLAVAWEEYRLRERDGIVKILAARRRGRLIGYNSFLLLTGHLHYGTTVHAMGDAIFVPKRLRGTGVGIRLIDQAETDLAAMFPGRWVRILYHDKNDIELLGPVLRRRGYTAFETMWDKMVRAT